MVRKSDSTPSGHGNYDPTPQKTNSRTWTTLTFRGKTDIPQYPQPYLFKQSYKYPLDIRVLLWNLKSSLLHIISKIPHLGFPTYPKWKRCGEEKKNNLLAISYAQMQFLHQIPLYKLKENPSILDLHATANRLCFLNRWQFSSTAISSAVGLLFKK